MNDNLVIVLDERAIADLKAATQWYGDRQPELAIEFLAAMDEIMERIHQYPAAYREVDLGVRRAVTSQFPYCIYYTLDRDLITVIAILHARRHPDAWKQRS